MRMPPNWTGQLPVGTRNYAYPSMEGGMRMPPNLLCRTACTAAVSPFNGGRHAHAAEWLPQIRGFDLGERLQVRALAEGQKNRALVVKGRLPRTPGQSLFRGLPRTLAVTGPLAEFR